MARQNLIDRADARAEAARAQIVAWLASVALLVAAMVVVGGATRLTDSGLSITEWQPLLGAVPPLNDTHWQAAFAKYKTIPQAAIVNKSMTLAEFKFIYWWEWGHRQLGRFIGVAFALPFAYFVARGMVSRKLAPRLLGIFALGGLQGAAGWFMVKSGLVDRIDVSPYRLTLHLTLAVIIFAVLIWTVLDLRAGDRDRLSETITAGQRRLAAWMPWLVLLQIALGGLVAGNKAGRAYNTWPTMDGQWIPDAIGALKPWYLNLTENLTTVQFDHRISAYVLAAAAALHALSLTRSYAAEPLVNSAIVLVVAVLAQAAIGIWTLIAAVPISLGLLHQAGALVVMALALRHAHMALYGPERASTLG